MAKVYSAPSDINKPNLCFSNIDNYEKESKEYEQQLKDKLVARNPKGKNVGEIIRFGVADGYARYMVANMKPVELVHIPLDDAWDFAYAHLLTAKEVQESIDREKAMAKLFSRNK